jgi:hypothetical protein
MSSAELNPPPLPPKVDLADLTEAVTAAVRRALEERAVTPGTPLAFLNSRISIGITVGLILEPPALLKE